MLHKNRSAESNVSIDSYTGNVTIYEISIWSKIFCLPYQESVFK